MRLFACFESLPLRIPCMAHLFSVFIFLFVFGITSNISHGAYTDTISSNSSLSGSQQLLSRGGNFALGFYRPGNTSNYYIAIWYAKLSPTTSVWVANRATPVSDITASVLRISDDGNLVLTSNNSTIWSTNISTTASRNTVALLNNTGNLVLVDGPRILWQSFDHPTDTWLPGGKISLNKITNKTQHLTSWRNYQDPSPGVFSLVLDPAGTSQYFILWNNTKQYWSSGTWNGVIFSGVPEMTMGYIYNFEYVSNNEENYFTYSVKDDSIITRLIMGVNGQIMQLTWVEGSQQWILFWSQPKTQCEVENFCGPFGSCNVDTLTYCSCLKGFSMASPVDWALGDQTSGCARNSPLQCEEDNNSSYEGDRDRFYAMPGMRLPDDPSSSPAGSGDECASFCLNNCSCTAYAYNNGCYLWHGGLQNLELTSDGSGKTLYLRLSASELPSRKNNKALVIGIVIGIATVAIACMAFIGIFISSLRRKRLIDKSKAMESRVVAYRYKDLQHVTKNFSEKLGSGGFGSVFRGVLPDSTAIAVKKLEGIQQGEKQFRAEVSTIGTIQHVNLVRLCGFCSEDAKRLLVYEYMPNGSLASQLFIHTDSKAMQWKTRYQIALGTARGLAYLHEQCRDRIIHCDIKPENILLDAMFIPKVADFGLAKLVGRDFSRVLTTMRGTRGYLAPEWLSGVPITAKADVYSYGMMLFEIISGRRNFDQGMADFFPAISLNKLGEENVVPFLDRRLHGNANLEEAERACWIACWCVQDDENLRPTMGHVVQMLEGVVTVNVPPIPRSLQILSENPENIVFFTDSSTQTSQVRSTSTSSQVTVSNSSTSKDQI